MVTKAVIPAAGLGTRFLPATKSQPKEMLPIVDKPSIQYVVEEAVAGRARRHPHHHRPRQAGHRGPLRPQLRARVLPRAGRQGRAAARGAGHPRARRPPLRPPTRPARARPRGVGRPPARRRRAVRGAARRRHHGRRRAAAPLHARGAGRGGRLGARPHGGARRRDLVLRLRGGRTGPASAWSRVRSPGREAGPRRGARRTSRSIGRYVFTPQIFDALDEIEPGVGGELQLTDAIAALARPPAGPRRGVLRGPLRHRPASSTSCAPTSSSPSTATTWAPSWPRSSPTSSAAATSREPRRPRGRPARDPRAGDAAGGDRGDARRRRTASRSART